MNPILRKPFYVFFLLMGITHLELGAQKISLNPNWWTPNGTVNAIAKDSVNNRVFIGGSFTEIGPTETYGTQVDSGTGIVNFKFANPNATVNASAADGKGGWYIGGAFTKIGDSARNRIAHIDSTGKLTHFMSSGEGFNNNVKSILLKNKTLYVGGDFTAFGSFKQYFF
jgi:hypothetical protein